MYILFIAISILSAIRLLRWLAIFQQKEYRFDRLLAFIRSKEGITELLRLIPSRQDFSRTGLKRPAITSRIAISTALTLSMIVLYFLTVVNQSSTLPEIYFHIILSYFLLPAWIFLGVLPSHVATYTVTILELKLAANKVKQRKPIIIGITGSYGKTSTKHLLTHVLREKYSVFTTPSSHNTKYSIAKAINTTFKDEELVVLEYAAYTKNEIKELCRWFPPNIAIITGLAPQHLELFGSLENIISAKAELIKALPRNGKVYYYLNNEGAKKIVEAGTKNMQVQVKPVDEKKLGVTNVELDDETAQLQLLIDTKKINTPFVGLHYLQAIILSLCVAQELEIDAITSAQRLQTFVLTKNFVRSYTLKTGALVIDDSGSANPEGVKAALELVRNTFSNKNNILIFPGIVDLGSQSTSIHKELAKLAHTFFHEVWYVGDVGKHEFKHYSNFVYDKLEDIKVKLANTNENDIILIEGRIPGWITQTINSLRVTPLPSRH